MTNALPPRAALDVPDVSSDGVPPACASDDGTLCAAVWEATESRWTSVAAEWLLARPVLIVLFLLAAFVVRYLLHKLINRVTRIRGNGLDGKVPTILRPFSERASAALQATGLISERRQQRAGALGSVLRSIASVLTFALALTLILDLFDVNLAPLLASAGVVGVALGFGAQSLVKDYLLGVFMIMEDQYGVGDAVDVGHASGTVEAVGLRVTTLRDVHGVVWYVRNGEIVRVGNKSQGWAQVVVDIPLPFGTDLVRAEAVMLEAATGLAADERFAADVLAPPEVLGVEQITATGMLVRLTVRTTTASQWLVARELRARISTALDQAGVASGVPQQIGQPGGSAGPT
ncbi:MAG TPA: mechanosensitive ion channel family protein [Cryptosporangiaceae bacterium]|nr:mechanosensitive ion channel family protein [Cryptosporangiaceae bacterium]